MSEKTITVGSRVMVSKRAKLWEEIIGRHAIVNKRSGRKFAITLLPNNNKKISMKPPPNQCAWFGAEELTFINNYFAANMAYINWVEDHEDDFCPDCNELVEYIIDCPKCGCSWR